MRVLVCACMFTRARTYVVHICPVISYSNNSTETSRTSCGADGKAAEAYTLICVRPEDLSIYQVRAMCLRLTHENLVLYLSKLCPA